jgi:hypothetical protein
MFIDVPHVYTELLHVIVARVLRRFQFELSHKYFQLNTENACIIRRYVNTHSHISSLENNNRVLSFQCI